MANQKDNNSTTIQYRTATPADVPGILDVLLAAPDDGMLYQFPEYHSHHDFLRKRFLHYFRGALHDPTILWRVATAKSSEDGTAERVVGYSGWMRTIPLPFPDPKTKALTKPKTFTTSSPITSVNTALLHLESLYARTLRSLPLLPSSHNPAENPAHRQSMHKARDKLSPSPSSIYPSYVLCGLGIDPAFQNRGIGKALVRWGMVHGAEEGVPVFTGGETRGVEFYQRALAFSAIPESEFWLDGEGKDTDAKSEAWRQENGGVGGAAVVWCPKGVKVELFGKVYEGDGRGLS